MESLRSSTWRFRASQRTQTYVACSSHSQDSQYRQRQLIIEMLCRETGGPCVYIGRPMKPVHTGLGITSDDWETFIGIIRNALDERHVQAPEKAELLQIFELRFRPTVVEQARPR